MENQYKKGQFAFDLAIAVVVIAFILYFGLTTVAEIHNSNEKSLNEQIIYNKLISAADYLVKVGAVETKEIYNSKAIYHHEITTESFNKIGVDELKNKLQLKELKLDFCKIEGCNTFYEDNLCINRIVLYNNETSILRVCGK